MTSTPIFLGGLDRSGKTYMRFMLESHPEIIFSKRTNLWTKYYQQYGSLEKEENLERCLTALRKNKHVLALSPDFEHIQAEFKQGSRSYERLFELIHQQFAEKNKKKFWGDQTGLLENLASNILESYPDAKFIHMIRDPRDRYAAILKKPESKQGLGIATARWLHSANLAQKNMDQYPNRYLVIRYETMVSDPAETISMVCDFLGVEYMPSMIQLDQIPRFDNESSRDGNGDGPITDKFIGQFRKDLSQGQTAFIEFFSRQPMGQFQYQLVEPSEVGKQRNAEYLQTWVLNLIQMLGWRVWTQLRRA